jgi:hypothetical protein
MPFRLMFSDEAKDTLASLRADASQSTRLAKTQKALAFLEANPRHPGLQSHRYQSKSGPNGEALWEAYVENQTPGAWRIWFWYGPDRETITVLTIGPHPD